MIPLEHEDHPNSDVRLVPIISFFKEQKINLLGLQFIHEIGFESSNDFFTTKKILGFLNLAVYLLKSIIYGLKHGHKCDIIFCEHLYSLLAGSVIKIVCGKPLIWDSHGNLISACKELNNSKIYTAIIWFFEKCLGSFPDMLVVPTLLDKQLYIEQGFKEERITVIPLCIDLKKIPKISNRVELREKLGLDANKKILLFGGKRVYLPNRDAAFWINDILAPIIEKEHSDIEIIITGSGDLPDYINKIVKFVGFVPNIQEYICAADICLIPVHLDNGVSTKLLEYMAFSRPVIADSSLIRAMPEAEDMVNLIVANNLEQFTDKVLWSLKNYEKLNEISISAGKTIEKYYNWELESNRWLQLLSKYTKERIIE
jgi:glycosyltransferase involved in cell wall biosynthesis